MKLAHFTDLHLRSALPGTSSSGARRSREVLAKFGNALHKAAEQKVDLIAITGDLLDVPRFLLDGVPRGFQMLGTEAWLQSVRTDYALLRNLLETTGIPYAVLPGNHDLPELFFEVFPEQPEFKTGGLRVVSFIDHEHEGNAPRRFVPSRSRFDGVLADADATPQIHLQHYLLNPADNDYPYHYPEHQFLRRRIEESGKVRLCLSGHYHKGTGIIESGGVAYAVTPGFCRAPHPWRIYELMPKGIRFEEQSEPCPAPSRVLFLDRDGVINDVASYHCGPEEMRLIPGSATGIKRLNERGIKVVVVTSQSCIGFGYVPETVVEMVHERMHDLLAREGAFVDAVYYTKGAGPASVLPDWESLPTRKSLLVQTAACELGFDLRGAWLVGDRLSDMEAAAEAGIGGMLVLTGDGPQAVAALKPEDSFPIAKDLREAVEQILEH